MNRDRQLSAVQRPTTAKARHVLPERAIHRPKSSARGAVSVLDRFRADDVQLNVAAFPHQAPQQPCRRETNPAALSPPGLPTTICVTFCWRATRKIPRGDIGVGSGDDLRAQFARQRQVLGQAFLVVLGQRLRLLDINRDPGAIEVVRQPPRPANHVRRIGAGADRQPAGDGRIATGR